jgi:spermidine dehydrogenase
MVRSINRRDFLNGVPLAVGGAAMSSSMLSWAGPGKSPHLDYPPAMTELRGNAPGSFETAHAVVRGEKFTPVAGGAGEDHDLIVVGAGISGLSAAFLYTQHAGSGARILVIDNNNDFGGHATRNEFTVGNSKLIGYGGSQSIDTPSRYSAVAKQLLVDVGINTKDFYSFYDRTFYPSRGMVEAIYFDQAVYGRKHIAPNAVRLFGPDRGAKDVDHVQGYPLSRESRTALASLLTTPRDYLKGHSKERKLEILRKTGYFDYLRAHAGATPELLALINDTCRGLWGIGWDSLSALEACRFEYLGTEGLALGSLQGGPLWKDEPYIFHFPDGNAGVARALVRKLNPQALPGAGIEDLVTGHVAYDRLDGPSSNTRIRLETTCVDVRHSQDRAFVEVTYVRHGVVARARAKHVILACNNRMIPYLCPDLPVEQRRAIEYAVRVPLVYINVAIRNWQAFAKLGYRTFYIPRRKLIHSFSLDFPVSIGSYKFPKRPTDPTVVHCEYIPTDLGGGLSRKEQHLAGRRLLYAMPFSDFEQDVVSKLDGALSGGGFDVERDVAAITVNRWPHGYAYEYNDYWDDPSYSPERGPHIAGRAKFGRISIANSDSSAYAYVDGAIDAAKRAVQEQLG